ncbi:Glutamate receptor ionotropic, delta-1 [Branchiostoma belcheri]|nr:Glutamate receptor ionotropic, delta-1 [Branchiostoma belcheri]
MICEITNPPSRLEPKNRKDRGHPVANLAARPSATSDNVNKHPLRAPAANRPVRVSPSNIPTAKRIPSPRHIRPPKREKRVRTQFSSSLTKPPRSGYTSLPGGAVFEANRSTLDEEAFLYAVRQINQGRTVLPKARLVPHVERLHSPDPFLAIQTATVTTRRTCFCVLSTCKNVGNRTASVRGEYHLRTESYGFGSTQTRRRTLSACNTFSTCGLRIYHPCVRVRATRVPRTAYERATYGLRESNFTILTCNCCTDSARSMCVPRTVLASSVLTPHFPVDLLNDHAEHTCTIPVYKDDLTGDCQLVSKMPRKAQKKTTRQDPKKRAAEDTRAASDDEVNRRCTHLQRASTACARQRSNRTEIVRCKHVQLTYHLRNVRCTQALTARRVVQTTMDQQMYRPPPLMTCHEQARKCAISGSTGRAAAGQDIHPYRPTVLPRMDASNF